MELKPCPFCGSTNLDYSLKITNSGYHAVVYCKDCHTYGPRTLIKYGNKPYPRERYAKDEEIKRLAAESWNNRK